MLPPPPRSTLFPYTTLFRSQRACRWRSQMKSILRNFEFVLLLVACFSLNCAALQQSQPSARKSSAARASSSGSSTDRSEEHTSELQSLTNLVCRLLLEKKKK